MALTHPDSSIIYNIRSMGYNSPDGNLGDTDDWLDSSEDPLWQFFASPSDESLYLARSNDTDTGDWNCLTTSPCDGSLQEPVPGCLGASTAPCNSSHFTWKLNSWSDSSSDGIYLWNTASDENHRLFVVLSPVNGDYFDLTDYREPSVNESLMMWELVNQGDAPFPDASLRIAHDRLNFANLHSQKLPESVTSAFPVTTTSPTSSPASTSTQIPHTSVGAFTGVPASSTATSKPAPTNSVGTIVGAIVGTVCFLALLAAAVYVYYLRNRRKAAMFPDGYEKPELDGVVTSSRSPAFELQGSSEAKARAFELEGSSKAGALSPAAMIIELPDSAEHERAL